MCGIFGIIGKEKAITNCSFMKEAVMCISNMSYVRGKDSSGIAFKNRTASEIKIIKGDVPIKSLLIDVTFKEQLNRALKLSKNGQGFQAIGHARLVTNGSQLKEYNNQPVVKDGIIAIHNGIIVNNNSLWENNPDLKREYDIDTEILLSLIKKEMGLNKSLSASISNAMKQIEGTVSSALLFDDRNELALITNNGSLYYALEEDYLIFASEEYFLKQVEKKLTVKFSIKQLKANTCLHLNSRTFQSIVFNFNDINLPETTTDLHSKFKIDLFNQNGNFEKEVVIDPMEFINRNKESHLIRLLENNSTEINKLKRCSKCILPETFPFIEFDAKGECNYCKNHKPQNQIKSFNTLRELVEPYKQKNGRPDCIVPFSGGRDSTYSLHIVKKELGLNPIAFTYDWGMVTDLARRNVARVCGNLGVENIVVSADIKRKRENIRKNIEAWLKSPDLGMVPLFMAGDKYFFYYCNEVKKQTGISLNIWGINNLENTNFKTGFAGLPPQFDKKRIYSLNFLNQMKLFGFVKKNLLKNPGYINQSIFDSLGSYAVRYLTPKKDYFHLFDYYKWDEKELEALIEKEYHWEKAIDTDSTWRIGDGTASFYNYIYYTVAGFTENDTFRSNQIREGMITREGAMNKVNKENEVRYETLRWYLEIVGVDFKKAIQIINSMPKLYPIPNE